MPYSHGIDKTSLRFCRIHSQFDFEESRSLTQVFQQNQLCAIHQFWAHVCAVDSARMVMVGIVMMGRVLLVIVIISVMVVIVQKYLDI